MYLADPPPPPPPPSNTRRNPNDRSFTFSQNFDGDPRAFHLEDLGSLGREESNAGDSLDRRHYQPEYSQYVHTPHPIKDKK
jgi:hypothetical protein